MEINLFQFLYQKTWLVTNLVNFPQLEHLECILEIESNLWNLKSNTKIQSSISLQGKEGLNEVRGSNIQGSAINYLQFSPEKASIAIEKTIKSAVANIMQNETPKILILIILKIKEAFC